MRPGVFAGIGRRDVLYAPSIRGTVKPDVSNPTECRPYQFGQSINLRRCGPSERCESARAFRGAPGDTIREVTRPKFPSGPRRPVTEHRGARFGDRPMKPADRVFNCQWAAAPALALSAAGEARAGRRRCCPGGGRMIHTTDGMLGCGSCS
jgi:hypothetical protein